MSISSRSEDGGTSRFRQKPETGKIRIGYVSSAHGLRGNIAVVPLTDFPERFQTMGSIDLFRDGVFFRTLKLEGVRQNGGRGTLMLETELRDRDEAERCVGAEILIDPEDRVELPPGSFWIDDLIGLSVEDQEGRVLGEVSDLFRAGGNELYEVRDPEGGLHYIPAVSEFIRKIDLEGGRISVSLIEGLW